MAAHQEREKRALERALKEAQRELKRITNEQRNSPVKKVPATSTPVVD
jgi:hypothetical protein